MDFSRRDLGKLALAGVPAAYVIGETSLFGAPAQAKPNSVLGGVIIGTITYSYGSMGDQSAEATLKYVVDSGISQIELMGGPVNSFLGAPGGGRGGARPGGPAPGGPGGPAATGGAPAGPGGAPGGGRAGRGAPDPATLTAVWNGVPCAPAGQGAAARGGGAPGGAPGGARGAQAPPTPEQQAAAAQAAADRKAWRESSATMDKVRALRKLYNDAGVQMYAVKNLSVTADDDELNFQFIVAKALGADHITAELPAGANAAAQLKRVGDVALRHGMYAAYHTHLQGNMTAFDEAFALSRGNKANIDFGHYVAAGSGNPVQFLEKFHDRIASFHLKDRTTPANCGLNLAWGTGETPLREILQTVKKNKWRIPATIELEYQIPQGSDAVKEVRKCLEYCRAALA
jgi:sugar phosphate isomerase/epimerase